MTDVEAWACQYISQVDPSFAQLSDAAKLKENVFTSGRLDSMALMNLLLETEMQFGFTFTPEAFQDRRLQTVSGLGTIVQELANTV